MPSNFNLELEIFAAALKLPGASARAAYLTDACAGDAALRQRVEALLSAHEEAGTYLQNSPPGARTAIAASVAGTHLLPSIEKPGDKIGRYKLLQQIGEGGCGTVYMAEQEEPVRRRVALKVIRLGMDTKTVVARFEAERQALALMDHPNIAKVFDGGATASGRPYFVMELVRGIKITEYCDQAQLTTGERLKLFIQVCQAVQHAHQKGVIHRDIKPSNILVTVNDGVAVPKVIDFGIAKATDQRLTDKTYFTEFHAFIGTPAYTSPEQAEMSSLDIDTRSDIYSLGVLLYEMLTGQTPFPAERLLQSGLDEMRRIIREEEPPKPSTRLTQERLATRSADAAKSQTPNLKSDIDQDLDWIVMKALEKDRTRRYANSLDFAADIQRHLDHEPVHAGAPSNLYKLQKLIRRNKGAFAAAAAVFLVLLTGLGLTAWQAVRAKNAEQAARRAEQAERAQSEQARADRDRAVLAETNAKAKESTAKQLLYESLIGEAQATRLAHRVGYREKAFDLIERARSVKPEDKDPALLRYEASLNLGDFVGQMPMVSISFPSNSACTRAVLNNAGDTVAVGMQYGDVRLYSAQSGEVLAVLDGSGGTVQSISFNASGDQLLTIHVPVGNPENCHCELSVASAAAVAYLWRRSMQGIWMVQTNTPLPYVYQCFAYRTGFGIVRRDRKEAHLSLLEYGTTNQIRIINWPSTGNSPELMLTPDGRFLATPADTEARTRGVIINVADISGGGFSQTVQTPIANLDSISLSPDGRYVGCMEGTGGYIYDRNNPLNSFSFQGYFGPRTRLAFAPHRTFVALPFVQQGRIRIFDWVKHQEVAVLDGVSQPNDVMFSGNGKFLVTRSPKNIRVYSLSSASEYLPLRGHSESVPAVEFSPDGTQLASVGKDKFLKVWNATTGEVIWETNGLPNAAQCVHYDSSGKFLITAELKSKESWIWDIQSGHHKLTIPTTGQSFNSVQCSPDGRFLAVSVHAKSSITNKAYDLIELWQTDFSGQLTPSVQPSKSIRIAYLSESLTFSPDGSRIAFGSSANLFVWDFLKATNMTRISTNLFNSSQGISFTPDSSRVVFINRRREVEIHDVTTAKKVFSFPTTQIEQGDASVTRANLSLSPDGRTLALVSKSKRGVNLWELATGRLLYSLREQEGSVWWLAWSPDSTRLAVARDSGDISIWKLNEVEQILTKINLPPTLPAHSKQTTETSQSNFSKPAQP